MEQSRCSGVRLMGALKSSMDKLTTSEPNLTVRVEFKPAWEMLGLRGQNLGEVSRCVVDLRSGRVVEVELATPWQTMDIPWQRVAVDVNNTCFQLVAD